MMIKEPITPSETGSIPAFESTLVIAFPDVLMAGPKILLSSAHAQTQTQTIPAWFHFSSPPTSSSKKGKATSATTRKPPQTDSVLYSTTTVGTSQHKVGLLTKSTAPATTEQASYLCEAIVNQARTSETQKIIILAASNVDTKHFGTHV
ncbi:hypothetical protein BGZ83_002526, partial [Gryganskiella cystojenkinii]